MNRLDPDTRALIELARGAEDGTSEDRARVRRKIAVALGFGATALAARGVLDSGIQSSLKPFNESASEVAGNGVALAERVSGEMVSAAAVKSAGVLGISPGSVLYAATFLLGGALIGGMAFLAVGREQASSEQASERGTRGVDRASRAAGLEEVEKPPHSQGRSTELALAPQPETPGMNSPIQPEDLPLLPETASQAPLPKAVPRRATPAARHRSGPSLSEEARDLSAAHEALREGNHALALARLDTMDRRPGGVLGEERLVARVLSLCGLGRVDKAEAIARRVQNVAPESPLLSRLQASCAKGALSH